jgi:hypothetical protein
VSQPVATYPNRYREQYLHDDFPQNEREPSLDPSESPTVVEEMMTSISAGLINDEDKPYIEDLLTTFNLKPSALSDDISNCKDPFEDIENRFEISHQILLDFYERTAHLTEESYKEIFVESLLFQQLRSDKLVELPLTKKGLSAQANKYAVKLFNVRSFITFGLFVNLFCS